mmetsp:Transcript_119862/g.339246  ORF Transcript_119862/g.339246 Transcript_119862/m.339246 type:complete len:101 (-) Transcript_119862:128-430(-)
MRCRGASLWARLLVQREGSKVLEPLLNRRSCRRKQGRSFPSIQRRLGATRDHRGKSSWSRLSNFEGSHAVGEFMALQSRGLRVMGSRAGVEMRALRGSGH